MLYYVACLAAFLFGFTINMTYITVFYHRAFTHRALTMTPWLRRFVAVTGVWITGMDPKAWCCMHRLHHLHSDTEDDPHSPSFYGVYGTFMGQLRSYERVQRSLIANDPAFTSVVEDLDFPVSWLKEKRLWLAPYISHGALSLAIGFGTGFWLLAAAYWLGMMSHPVQGWLVNGFAHSYGYRNYATSDRSRNNTWVAFLVMGEGYQNNHHRHPSSAKFSVRWFEIDLGYGLCLVVELLGLATIDSRRLQLANRRQRRELGSAALASTCQQSLGQQVPR